MRGVEGALEEHLGFGSSTAFGEGDLAEQCMLTTRWFSLAALAVVALAVVLGIQQTDRGGATNATGAGVDVESSLARSPAQVSPSDESAAQEPALLDSGEMDPDPAEDSLPAVVAPAARETHDANPSRRIVATAVRAAMVEGCRGVLARLRYSTKDTMPPS